MADDRVDDNIQHGIDDDAHNDPAKGAAIGGIGGAVTGAVAGSAVGPVGSVVGAVIGGVAGAVASGAAVAAIDQMDNDNTVTGVGRGVTTDVEDQLDEEDEDLMDPLHTAPAGTATTMSSGAYATGTNINRPDVGTADSEDAPSGDRYDDKTGKPIR
jgi:hypothetical protein